MANLGSGNGSGYPSTLDTQSPPESGATLARADVPNDFASAIIAVQTELGTDPAGTETNVKAYLEKEHMVDGTHGEITPTKVTIGGDLIEKFGGTLASATNLLLGSGSTFDISGAIDIASISSRGIGSKVLLRFLGVLTIVNDDDLIDIGSDIITKVGTSIEFFEYDTGKYRLVNDGTPSGLVALTEFAVNGNWTPNVRAKSALILASGGGGGGGSSGSDVAGGGGGAGSTTLSFLTAVSSTLAIVVGIEGVGQNTDNGTDGGITTVGGSITALGGRGGRITGSGGEGGMPGVGGIPFRGGDGASAEPASTSPGGLGGSSFWGGGGSGGGSIIASRIAKASGSGGGGAFGDATIGSNGKRGIVVILEYA